MRSQSWSQTLSQPWSQSIRQAWSQSIRQALDKVYKHGVSYQASKVCITKERLPECPMGSAPREVETKMVASVCLSSNNRKAKELVKMAYEGSQITKLRSMQKSFSSTIQVPK